MLSCAKCGSTSPDNHHFCSACGGDLRGLSAVGEGGDHYLGMTIASKFVLRELIGSGGMGKVYRSDQIGVGRTVAVKIMHRHLLGDETAAARFANEARAASQLNHPNIISLLDFGQTEGGLLYMVMEYLRGRSLDVVLQYEFPIPFGRVASILCQTMDAVEAAHKLNIIHRDLKPENIFLEQSTGHDFVKVLDFGIAKMLDLEDRSITTPGLVPGTPEYMSPEQARGEPLGPRSDVYSLGVLLYELLTATVPFGGSSALTTMMAHVQDPPEPPSKRYPARKIPDVLDSLVLWGLAKKQEDRIASAAQYRDLLAAWAEASGLWPAEEGKRATQTNVLLQYFPKDQVRRFKPMTGKKEALFEPSRGPTIQPRSRTSAADPGIEETIFFGREIETQRLEALLSDKRTGRALRIQAAAGMGKTALALHVVCKAPSFGLAVIHCQPQSSAWAKTLLGPAQWIARSCLGLDSKNTDAEDILMAAGQIGMEAEDIPGIQELFGITSHLSELDPDARRRERATAFRHLVYRAAAKKPLLLFIEELDRFDEPSRDLIFSLIAAAGGQSLTLLITHSPNYAQLWPPEVELLDLSPLDEDACAAMVHSLFAQDVAPEMIERISRIARGQPLFIEQLVYAEVCEGIADPPGKVADLLAARVERLPQEERNVLQWVAAYNDQLSPKTLNTLMKRKVDEQTLERLVSKGFLRATRRGYTFVHHLVTMVVYSSIPVEVRRTIHHSIAEYLRHLDAPISTVAYHSYEADDGPRAVEELDRAGAWAFLCLDNASAIQYYSRALEMVRKEWGKGRMLEVELDQMAVDLARRLAHVLRQKGDTPAARGVLEETLSVAADEDISRGGLRLDLGRIDLEFRNLQRGLRHLELAQADAEMARSDWLLGEVTRELARAIGLLEDREKAGELIGLSLDYSSRASGQRGVPPWTTLLEIANVCLQIGFSDRARGYLIDALQQAENDKSIIGKLQIITRMAEIHQNAGEWADAEMRLTEALDLTAQVGDRSRKTKLLTDLGRIYRIQGAGDQGRNALTSAIKMARSIGWWEALKQAEKEIEMLPQAFAQPP